MPASPGGTHSMRLGGARVLGGTSFHAVSASSQGWKVDLFTTSAPGSGDELRLALCLPRAGPGLSHGGQMTAESKWVLSYSPREPRTPRPSKAVRHLRAREREGGDGTRFRPPLLLLWPEDPREVRTAPSFSSQARSPECPSLDCP